MLETTLRRRRHFSRPTGLWHRR